jgi:hypothetical protein
MDWTKSPLEVPIPTQREASPEEPLGASGRVKVEVASRMNESSETGPVLKAGPMAAFTDVKPTAASAETTWLTEGIALKVGSVVARTFNLYYTVKESCLTAFSPG